MYLQGDNHKRILPSTETSFSQFSSDADFGNYWGDRKIWHKLAKIAYMIFLNLVILRVRRYFIAYFTRITF